MLRRVRAWLLLSVGLLACGRTELQLGDRSREDSGVSVVRDAGISAFDATVSDVVDATVPDALDAAVPAPVRPAPNPSRCITPALPILSVSSCIEALCACDEEAFASCDLDCWTKLVCRVQTCTSDPTRAECTVGCPEAPAAEQALGRCYRRTPQCADVL